MTSEGASVPAASQAVMRRIERVRYGKDARGPKARNVESRRTDSNGGQGMVRPTLDCLSYLTLEKSALIFASLPS